MNKQFISKMIKAKKIELEAIQELLPDKVKGNIDEMADSMKGILKECIMEIYFSGNVDSNRDSKMDHKNSKSENEKNNPYETTIKNGKKQMNKITIE